MPAQREGRIRGIRLRHRAMSNPVRFSCVTPQDLPLYLIHCFSGSCPGPSFTFLGTTRPMLVSPGAILHQQCSNSTYFSHTDVSSFCLSNSPPWVPQIQDSHPRITPLPPFPVSLNVSTQVLQQRTGHCEILPSVRPLNPGHSST